MTVSSEQSIGQTEQAEPDRDAKRRERRNRITSWLCYVAASAIYRTIRLHCENMEGLLPGEGGAILVTWHGRTLIPANLLKNRGYYALISLSRDGELQNQIFQRYGFHTIRGSTGRGGVRGALQMARKVREGGVLTFTPDGPRGPTHKVQPGVILMAAKSGAPIVPVGISASRRWLIKSWDSYLVPKPFARAYFVVGEPIYVPADLNDDGRQIVADQIEIAINCLEREAEYRAGHIDYPAEWRAQ
jgi:lysophospholipid acyltransferase (LPLAT)-like uncharacterized protein